MLLLPVPCYASLRLRTHTYDHLLCYGQWLQFPQQYDKTPRGTDKRTAGSLDGRKDASKCSRPCRPAKRVEPKNTFPYLHTYTYIYIRVLYL